MDSNEYKNIFTLLADGFCRKHFARKYLALPDSRRYIPYPSPVARMPMQYA